MRPDFADEIVEQFERGDISRRQLASRLMGLGAVLAVMPGTAHADQGGESTFRATRLDHVALNVRDVPRSRDWYIKHLGLDVIRDGGADNCFLGSGGGFFLTLFRGDKPGLNHYCYAIKDFDVDRAEAKLRAAGLKIRRESDRIYFEDPDGIEVQVSG
ncbi:VOC family protein [Aquisphaera insulae]|uniref:VOC family protein n=1 Tax=Aquisphaera insulae TaxID=2712864 RepID=UPI0013EBB7B6|nr:VOC family protein [Aquisphaera insulae]